MGNDFEDMTYEYDMLVCGTSLKNSEKTVTRRAFL